MARALEEEQDLATRATEGDLIEPSDHLDRLGLRQRVARGLGAQVVAHVTRVATQFGIVGILLPIWGLQLYGEWLILVGVAVLIGSSDFGFVSAAASDMIMAVGRGDREHALDVFRSLTRGLVIVFSAILAVASVAVLVVPIVSALGLHRIGETTAAVILLLVALRILVLVFSLLLYGGFACEGYYGEGIMYQSAIIFGETAGPCVVAIFGGGPLVATAAALAVRIVGTATMYASMRRRAPWLSLGRPTHRAQVRKRLTRPALSLASIGWGTALNVQVTVVIVGITSGAGSAAVFATVRALSRIALQLTGSISQAVGPELGKAYAEGNEPLAARLQLRITQSAIWSSAALSIVLAAAGTTFLGLWTHGHVRGGGILLILLLVAAGLEGAWMTAGSLLFFTNRHQEIGRAYAILSVLGVPAAYAMATVWGPTGVAISLIATSVLMLAEVLRLSLPVMHETLAGWVRSLVRPTEIWQALIALRAHVTSARGAAATADQRP